MAQAVSSTGSGRLPVAAWGRLYNERVARRLSQDAAAQLCFVTQQTFSDWEQKLHKPSVRSRESLAAFLNLSRSELREEIAIAFPCENE